MVEIDPHKLTNDEEPDDWDDNDESWCADITVTTNPFLGRVSGHSHKKIISDDYRSILAVSGSDRAKRRKMTFH